MPSIKRVLVAADPHFDLHDARAWQAFRTRHAAVRPALTVILGDVLDLGMLSRFTQEPDAQCHVDVQIDAAVPELNALREECGRLLVMEGNHDERLFSSLIAKNPTAFRKLRGLTLPEQMRAFGMREDIEWVREGVGVHGIWIGPEEHWGSILLRHGDKNSSRYGLGVHLARSALMKNGCSVAIGHAHRAQMYYQTQRGRTRYGIAVPCLCQDMHYAGDPDWQRGWLEVDVHGESADTRCVPTLRVLDDQRRCVIGGREVA